MRASKMQGRLLARRCSAWFTLVVGLLLLAAVVARADGSLTLAWDYKQEDEISGFRLYWGFTNGFYVLTNDVGLVTEVSVSNLLGGETYHFAVSSFDLSGREGDLSNEILHTVPVASTNELPIISLISVETDEDQPVLLPLIGTNVLVAVPPSHGKVVGGALDARYVPDTNFSGADSFKLFLFNGAPVATKVEVSVNVRPVNDPPWTADQTVVTAMDVDIPIHLIANDAEEGTLRYTLESTPQSGSLVGDPPDLRYRPTRGFEGQDEFTYRVSDGELDSDIATVSISVLAEDRIPVVEDLEFSINEDVRVGFLLNSYRQYLGSAAAEALE
ncbi:MAG TPA: Ig-like domain-containing protein, partial [Verrucomicrobiae bacterium]|nr:Ig-like domain-containing protein [Verrucomicrobiae bacterium]